MTVPLSRRLVSFFVSLCVAASFAACASERAARVERDEGREAHVASTEAAPLDDALARQWLERAREREARQATKAWRCLVEKACGEAEEAPAARARQDLELALEVLRQSAVERAEERLAFRTAARVALEEAAAPGEVARRALEDGLVLHHGREMPFAFADLPVALAQAEPDERLSLLASAAPVVEQRASLGPSVTEARGALARRAGRSDEALLALRAGVDERELGALVADVLDRTAAHVPPFANGPADIPALLARHEADLDATSWRRGALVSAFSGRRAGTPASLPHCVVIDPPGDVRLVEGASSPPSLARYARACASAAARLAGGPWDPAWLHVVASLSRHSAWLSGAASADPRAPERRRAVYVLEARRLALEVRAWLDDVHERASLDALASLWTSPRGAPLVGASGLLALDPSGAAADALVALVVAAALDNALVARFGPSWAADAGGAAVVEEELERLGAVWHEAGPRGVLRALGLTSVDATPLLARVERLSR